VVAGNPVTFEAGAIGDPTPTMQWQRADATGAFTDVPGETNPTITVVPVAGDDYDRFRAVFTNPAGSVIGGTGVLRVWVSPVLTQTSTDQTVVEGTPAVFTVHATGNPAPEVTWMVSSDENGTWTVIPGATGDSYSTGPTTLAMSGYYYQAIVSNYGAALVTPYSVLTVTPSTTAAVPPLPTEPITRLKTPKAAAPLSPAGPRKQNGTAGGALPRAGALPTTGTDSSATATSGAAMLGAGVLLALAGRRRRRTS
jgi:MYXO-CTERM domain-containing protein